MKDLFYNIFYFRTEIKSPGVWHTDNRGGEWFQHPAFTCQALGTGAHQLSRCKHWADIVLKANSYHFKQTRGSLRTWLIFNSRLLSWTTLQVQFSVPKPLWPKVHQDKSASSEMTNLWWNIINSEYEADNFHSLCPCESHVYFVWRWKRIKYK